MTRRTSRPRVRVQRSLYSTRQEGERAVCPMELAYGKTILTLRSLAQSDRFERGWALLAETYKSKVRLNGR